MYEDSIAEKTILLVAEIEGDIGILIFNKMNNTFWKY